MTNHRITINGQQYDSPEAMPPDVRRTYEEAMRTVGPSLASGHSGGSTQVFTGRADQRINASVVVNRTITVNDRTYGSVDELPPDVRQLYEDALKGATPQGDPPQDQPARVGEHGGAPGSDPRRFQQPPNASHAPDRALLH